MCTSNHLWQWFYPKETTVPQMKQDLYGWPITQSNQYSIAVTLKTSVCHYGRSVEWNEFKRIIGTALFSEAVMTCKCQWYCSTSVQFSADGNENKKPNCGQCTGPQFRTSMHTGPIYRVIWRVRHIAV